MKLASSPACMGMRRLQLLLRSLESDYETSLIPSLHGYEATAATSQKLGIRL